MSIKNSNLEFRAVPSLQFLYEVNENGTVLRNIKSKKQIKIINDMHHTKGVGYYAAFVSIKGKPRRVAMHSIVAECWLGKRPDGMEIDHIDRNPHNNWHWNLRYVTHSDQMKNRRLSERVIKTATNNCYQYTMKYVAKPVQIILKDKTEIVYFPSMIQCAEYIADKYKQKPEQVRHKLKKRRSSIFDYDIRYLKA
jgi:hypothetical protein